MNTFLSLSESLCESDVTVRPCIRLYGHLVHFVVRLKGDRSTEVEYETDDWISPTVAKWHFDPIIADIVSRCPLKFGMRKASSAILTELLEEMLVMWQSGIIFPCPVTGRLGIRFPHNVHLNIPSMLEASSTDFQRDVA